MIKFLKKISWWLVQPKSKNEDSARRELILNILLLGTLFLSLAILISYFTLYFGVVPGRTYFSGEPPWQIITALSLGPWALFFFSRAGFHRLVSYILIFLCLFSAIFTSYSWGVDVPQGLLLYVLAIVMAGILIGSKFAFVITLITSCIFILLTYLQTKLIIQPDLYWTEEKMPQMNDILVMISTLGVITTVSWLFNREIEKALHRARGSEKALKEERDLLEIKVDERTKELKRTQLEKILHLYRLADFGRMTAGLFHDLSTPLTTVSLNLEKLSRRDTSLIVKRAVQGTKHMENFVKSVRKQIQKQKVEEVFCPNKEIYQVIRVLDHKAQKLQVKLPFVPKKDLSLYGNPLRFNQVVTNLVTNAIDAYDTLKECKNRQVLIKLSSQNNNVALTVQDFGCGIAKKNIKKIFEPFFTTKSIEKGTGVGLSICKDIVEKELNGKVKVKSKEKQGATFTVVFPLRKAPINKKT